MTKGIKYTVFYQASDGYGFKRNYKTEEGLSRMVVDYIGYYKPNRQTLVSNDGVGRVHIIDHSKKGGLSHGINCKA